MKNHQQGYILLITLVFMQIFAVIAMFSLTTLTKTLRMSNDIYDHQSDLINAENVLRQIESGALLCVIPITADISYQSITWWQEYACSENAFNLRYDYVVEKLHDDACAFVATNPALKTEYYRITLKIPVKSLLLQSTIVRLSDEKADCTGSRHEVNMGRQMRRILMIRNHHDREFEG